jgi:hypothetical protein
MSEAKFPNYVPFTTHTFIILQAVAFMHNNLTALTKVVGPNGRSKEDKHDESADRVAGVQH